MGGDESPHELFSKARTLTTQNLTEQMMSMNIYNQKERPKSAYNLTIWAIEEGGDGVEAPTSRRGKASSLKPFLLD